MSVMTGLPAIKWQGVISVRSVTVDRMMRTMAWTVAMSSAISGARAGWQVGDELEGVQESLGSLG